MNFLVVLISVISLSSSKIVHNVNEYLYEPPRIDLTQNGAETILYVRLCESSSMNGSQTILNMTRYCYCRESKSFDPNDESCSIPGPTLVMHDYTNINVTVVNEVIGSNIVYNGTSSKWNTYKDMDVTNLHVHGLHVSPKIDDVLVKIYPSQYPSKNIHSYPYDIGYHYPGTFWYHAHHHGSTTWQVNMGLHGAISMNQDGDNITDKYKENILMFEWFYVIPSSICNPGHRNQTCTGSDTEDNEDMLYSPRFQTYRLQEGRINISSNYAMCDIYCSFPHSQRDASGYVYDVTTDLSVPESIKYDQEPIQRLLLYFVNGQLSPKISMTTGEFRRLRMINSLSNWYLQFQFPSECGWYLIATDGVYIRGPPYQNYDLSQSSHNYQYIMSPGGRADFMVNCTTPGLYEIKSTNATAQDPEMLSRIGKERVYTNVTLFRLEVSDGIIPDGTNQLPNTTDVPVKRNRSYIQDLTGLTDSSSVLETKCYCNYNGDPSDNKCEINFMFTTNFTHGAINGKQFNITTPNYPHTADALTLIQANKAYEFIINNNKNTSVDVAHVYHQHINPFQVQRHVGKNGFIALNTTWWDTLGNNPGDESDYIRMRFWTRDYTGLIITHCHLLQHEDKGMMGFYEIMNATEINPNTCPNQDTTTTEGPVTDTITTFYSSTGDDGGDASIKYVDLYIYCIIILLSLME